MADALITAAQLRKIMPMAGARADVFAPYLSACMLQFEISTPTRSAAFLAQVGHESGQLRLLREIWGPTPAQIRYEGRADLGNTEPGDGKRYMGRGLIQITGRKNYLLCGFDLHLDLIAHPELLEQAEHAAASAGWYWHTHNLNRFADAGDFVGLTRAINGGTNGIADRRALWNTAKQVLEAA
ncbi:chitinase [Cupriavidus sp. SHE]|uniref:glycoside hydrolase family 19 protein n=1 Tax=Cupriavidus TaxID=106589 RepID=UPI0004A633BC|nr:MULTISPECIES: glycoside hydrolase family 19 protein [Cupriavidus]KWR79018.1 chitinase [Cupriavidus sp. SHE]